MPFANFIMDAIGYFTDPVVTIKYGNRRYTFPTEEIPGLSGRGSITIVQDKYSSKQIIISRGIKGVEEASCKRVGEKVIPFINGQNIEKILANMPVDL